MIADPVGLFPSDDTYRVKFDSGRHEEGS
jgi:hypothetical protein